MHGGQEGRFYHGYYGHYCYLPLYLFIGEHLLCSRLRPSNIDASAGSVEELERIVGRIRAAWPSVRLIVRGDSGFCREEIMAWCEQNRVDYVLGLARNSRLVERITKALHKSGSRCVTTGRASRRYRQFRYRTEKSCSRKRRVVAKVEWLAKGANPRFVVTSLGRESGGPRQVYRIKECQLGLFADRTSSATLRANQLRLYFASFAYVLLHGLRRLALAKTRWVQAQCTTLRVRFLKIAARVRITVRRVWLSFASAYPHRDAFAAAVTALSPGAALETGRVIPASPVQDTLATCQGLLVLGHRKTRAERPISAYSTPQNTDSDPQQTVPNPRQTPPAPATVPTQGPQTLRELGGLGSA